jgi:hypothetical protein
VCEIVNDLGNSGFVPSKTIPPTSIVSLPGLPPLSDSDFYLRNLGAPGTSEPESPIALQVGHEYLVFVRFERDRYDVPVRLGFLLGVDGVLSYDSESNTVSPVRPAAASSFMEPLLRKSNHLTDLQPLLQKARAR